MLKEEFLKYVKQNNINLKKYNIVIEEKSNTPYTIGCYKEEEKWYLYEIGERQSFSITKSGNENEIFNYLYLKLRGIIGGNYAD